MKRYSTMWAVLSLAAAAGTAAGQAQVQGELDKPMRARQRSAQGGHAGQSVMSLSQRDGDSTVEVRIVDGNVESAKVNGKEVPKDRVRQSDNKVEILDRDGDVIHTINVGRAGAGGVWFGGPEAFERLKELRELQVPGWGGDQEMFFSPEVHAPPKVMLGINMEQPDEDTAEKLEINAEEAILVSKVIEGLPAAEAGLRDGDVVVRIAGKAPATPDKLREILRDKEPGDTLKVTVVREGDEKTLTIQLEEYDPEKLGVQHLKVEPFEMFGEGGHPGWDEDARKAYEEAMKGLQGQGRAFRWEGAPGAGGRGMTFRRIPSPPGTPQVEGRLTDLDKRMAEIDRRLSELDKQLERLTQKLEKLNEERR